GRFLARCLADEWHHFGYGERAPLGDSAPRRGAGGHHAHAASTSALRARMAWRSSVVSSPMAFASSQTCLHWATSVALANWRVQFVGSSSRAMSKVCTV